MTLYKVLDLAFAAAEKNQHFPFAILAIQPLILYTMDRVHMKNLKRGPKTLSKIYLGISEFYLNRKFTDSQRDKWTDR